jgi:hypothetical protein
MGLSAVDDAIGKEPPLGKDIFWNDVNPVPLYANGTENLPICQQNATKTERMAMNLLHVFASWFCRCWRTKKVADNESPEQEPISTIPDSSDQEMFREERKLSLAQKLAAFSLTGLFAFSTYVHTCMQ